MEVNDEGLGRVIYIQRFRVLEWASLPWAFCTKIVFVFVIINIFTSLLAGLNYELLWIVMGLM